MDAQPGEQTMAGTHIVLLQKNKMASLSTNHLEQLHLEMHCKKKGKW